MKRLKYNGKRMLAILLCLFVLTSICTDVAYATEKSFVSRKSGQKLTSYSKQIIEYINNEQYEQARSTVDALSDFYLEGHLNHKLTLEAHNAFAAQILAVKTELTRHKLDRDKLAEEGLKLHLAAEVFTGHEIKEFVQYMDGFYQNAADLLDHLATSDSQTVKQLLMRMNGDFYLLSAAIQILYPPEYYTQIESILKYLNTVDQAKIHEAKEVIQHLVTTLETMNKHAKKVHSYLTGSTMPPKTYLLGISVIIATALTVVFWRKWRVVEYTKYRQ